MKKIIRYMLKKLPLVLLFTVFLAGIACSNTDSKSSAKSDMASAPGKLNPASDEMPSSVDAVIKWNTRVEQNGCDATLIVEVTQLDHWHIYSQDLPDGAMNIPTTFDWGKTAGIKYVGKTQEPASQVIDNDGFPERPLNGDKVIFKQKIKVEDGKAHDIKMNVEFMACKEACFPPTFKDFVFKVKACSAESSDENSSDDNKEETEEGDGDEGEEAEGDEDSLAVDSSQTLLSAIDAPVKIRAAIWKVDDTNYELTLSPKVDAGWSVVSFENQSPIIVQIDQGKFEFDGELGMPEFKSEKDQDGNEVKVFKDGQFVQKIKIKEEDTSQIINATVSYYVQNDDGQLYFTEEPIQVIFNVEKALDKKEQKEEKKSYWSIFLLAFGGGLVALLTPCVFPMIPMTVSFFTKGSENRSKGIRKGVLYGVSILLIYVSLSIPFHIFDGVSASIFNQISTNAPLNIFFFLMLFVFGLSFLGAFEITLPSKWTNKVDSASDIGGIIGVFLMALTLVIVSFSCTGPILGGLLAGATNSITDGSEAAWTLTAGLAGFGIALGLPFALFAIFPSWLNGLPSSGGWLNTVKVVLGFLEIAFSLKFLSQADMGLGLHMLERELFIALWIGIFAALALYLFNVYRTSHDSPVQSLSTFRLILATFILSFAIYMIPGLWGAPLKLISAFPPPQSYSESPYGILGEAPETDEDIPDCAVYEHGMVVFRNEYECALDYAREHDMPLLLDFTGIYCVNCRKMESNVWSDPEIHEIMNKKFVVVSLYVDDYENMLDKPETSRYTGKTLKSHGDKWADMQVAAYGKATQPQYILLDHYEMQLTSTDATYASHGSIEEFKAWLEEGLQTYEERKNIPVYTGKVTPVISE